MLQGLLGLLGHAEIRGDDAADRHSVELHAGGREGNREEPSGGHQRRFVAGLVPGAHRRQRIGYVGLLHQAGQPSAHDLGAVLAQHPGKAPVGVEDDAALRHRERPFGHVLDDHPVRPLCAGERVDLLSARLAGHDGIRLAAADGVDGCLELRNA